MPPTEHENTEYLLQHQGTVFKKALGQYSLYSGDRIVTCAISNRLRKQLVYPTSPDESGTLRRVQKVKEIKVVDPVAIGDQVGYEPTEEDSGIIREVLPRRNQLVRQAAEAGKHQVIAANVDQVVPILAVTNPAPRWHWLDRFLVAAESQQIPALIVLTKADLIKQQQIAPMVQLYQDLGYRVLLTSVESGRRINYFSRALNGKLSVLVGMSGVGKTSLLNAVQPDLGLRVNTISNFSGKGRHTTTHLEMFPLEVGGYLVDTPGIKTFGLVGLPKTDLPYMFREMRPLIGQCRFRTDCAHRQEPGCAIKDAVAAGTISKMRYESFLRM
jgi:ribosome biogenesis GTPase